MPIMRTPSTFVAEPSKTIGETRMRRSQISRSVSCLIAVLFLGSSAFAGKMTFKVLDESGGSTGNPWIAAAGEIAQESADDLETYLNKEYDFAKNSYRYNVLLDSPGGNLIGGIKLGEFFRRQQFATRVTSGICASACAIAFIGGIEREAANGKLGVHQFYNALSLRNPSEKVFDALDMSTQQLLGAVLIDYAFRMGVDPRYIAIAAATSPDQMHFLNQEELDSLKVNWNPKTFEPWSIEPSGRGVVAFTKSKDKTETAVLFCRSDRVPRLLLRPDRENFDWYQKALQNLESLSVFGINVPKNGLTLKKINDAPALEVPLRIFVQTTGTSSVDRNCFFGSQFADWEFGTFGSARGALWQRTIKPLRRACNQRVCNGHRRSTGEVSTRHGHPARPQGQTGQPQHTSEPRRRATQPSSSSARTGAEISVRVHVGARLSVQTAGFARLVERAGAEAKLKFKAHPHMLRYARGFALANRGHDTRALQAFLTLRPVNG
jgi:hypothetical protein